MSSPDRSSAAMPVHPESTACSARYSSAASPSEAALTRMGRSFDTIVTCWPDRQIGRTERHPQRAPVADVDGEVESAVLDAQVVEVTQCASCEVPQLGIVALGLELRDDHDRQHYRMLREAEECLRVAEQN